MSRYEIAALPGDGIGPEVMDAALQVLGTVDVDLQITCYQAGAGHFREHGETLPADVLQSCLDADAVLLSAIGLPDVRKSDGTEVQPEMMIGLRRALGLHSAVRPIRLYPGVPSPLSDVSTGIDLVIVRENLEGLFASFGGGCLLGDQVATDTLIITREGTKKVVDYAFRLAQRRSGRPTDGQHRVTCVDKANIFRSFAFFRKVFFEVAEDYSDIAAEAVYVDAMSMYLVQNPSDFDVLVMENQFGDILSDLGAGIVGGLGLAPSAEVGEKYGLFQPSHGSAPQIAGKNIANPMAMILSAAMMLDWLGQTRGDVDATAAAQRIEDAVAACLSDGTALTHELGGRATTSQAAETIVQQLKR